MCLYFGNFPFTQKGNWSFFFQCTAIEWLSSYCPVLDAWMPVAASTFQYWSSAVRTRHCSALTSNSSWKVSLSEAGWSLSWFAVGSTPTSTYHTFWKTTCLKRTVLRSPLKTTVYLLSSFLVDFYYPKVTDISYHKSVCRLSVVCNVRAPYSAGWNFRQHFYAILYPNHPITTN